MARFSQTILHNRQVETLLVSGQITNGEGLDLRGANLDGFNLSGVSFRHADLTGASLRATNLEGANLAETMCIGADFTSAKLTGACLEAWNIDATTVLHQVDCRYVFLASDKHERRPHDPKSEFEPGDFTKLYQQVMTTMEILLRQGVTREALGQAFGELMLVHPEITPEAVQSIERKGDDLLLRMNVPAGVDKGRVEETLQSALQQQLLLHQREVRLLESHNQDLKEIAMAALTNGGASITVGGSIVAKEDRSIKVRGNFTTGDVSGSLTGNVHHHNLQSLAETNPELAKLLAELEAKLAAAPGLTPDDKALASEKVGEIAKAAAATAEDGALVKAGRTALLTLKGLAGALPDITKIIEAVGKAMEAIGKLQG